MLQIYDTTLRDGMQGMKITFTLEDKLELVKELDAFKIDYIEGGFPQSNKKEAAFFDECKNISFSHAKLAAFGPTCKVDGEAHSDSNMRAVLDAQTPVVTIVGKSWMEHVKMVLGCSAKENIRIISDSIRFLKSEGREVIFDLEHFFDGYKDDSAYSLDILRAASEAGADLLVLCDTNGGTLPHEVEGVFDDLADETLAPLGGHFHDDCGTATANCIVAVAGGARQIQGTINGWGERVGNANLCVFMPNAAIKLGYEFPAASELTKLTHLSRLVAERANLIPDTRQPFVGQAAFSHKAGQHADVIHKAAHLMEHIDSKLIGNTREILLSELAGKATIVLKLQKYGDYNKKSLEVNKITELLKTQEEIGYEYEAAEASFDLLIRRVLDRYKPLLELRNWHLESYKSFVGDSRTVGRLFLYSEHREFMGAAVGVGPVETLDAALRDALGDMYTFLNEISLIDYRVRVLSPEGSAAAKVRVFITCSNGSAFWDTVGVHQNVIEASWQALVDGYEYYYNNYIVDKNKIAK